MFESKKKWAQKSAVSEVLGTVLLLGMAVIIFSSLIIYVMSATDRDDSSPNLDLVGYIGGDDRQVIIEHRGGESLDLKNVVIYVNKGVVDQFTVTFDKEGKPSQGSINNGRNGRWDIGGYYSYDFGENIQHWQVEVIIVDQISNSIIMSGVVNTGIDNYLSIDDTQVDFSWTPGMPLVGENIKFTGEVTITQNGRTINGAGFVTDWGWGFEDGTGSGQICHHSYSSWGAKTVTLTVTYDPSVFNCTEPFTNSTTKTVTVYQGPVAAFTWNPRWPYVGQKVNFTSTSTPPQLAGSGEISQYKWTFGDGQSITSEKWAEHVYAKVDIYKVTLTVSAVVNDRTLTNSTSNYVTVNASIPVDFPYADLDNSKTYTPGDIDVSVWMCDGTFDTNTSKTVDGRVWNAISGIGLVIPSTAYGGTYGDGEPRGECNPDVMNFQADTHVIVDASLSAQHITIKAHDIYLSYSNPISIDPIEGGGDKSGLTLEANGNISAAGTSFDTSELA